MIFLIWHMVVSYGILPAHESARQESFTITCGARTKRAAALLKNEAEHIAVARRDGAVAIVSVVKDSEKKNLRKKRPAGDIAQRHMYEKSKNECV
jgi:hypothetical protein